MNKPLKFITSNIASFAAGGIGSLATTPNIPTWYAGLDKPWFNPPNWVFGPVWTLLYLLMGISLYLVWSAPQADGKRKAYLLFGMQLTLNAAWSLIFFGTHALWAAVIVIMALLVLIIMTMRCFWQFSRIAAWLLLPYALWVGFATCLNIGIALLN